MNRTITRISILAAVAAITAAALAAAPQPAGKVAMPTPRSNARFDVHDFGAGGDGTSIDTRAINDAIDAAAKAGGGTVYFGAGTYSAYSIHMQSNVGIYLDHGAVLQAAGNANERVPPPDSGPPGSHDAGAARADALSIRGGSVVSAWDQAEPYEFDKYQDYGHSHFHNSLIWGENLHDVSIEGPGTIDGKGLVTNADANTTTANKSLALKRCRNVTLRDVTFFRGGHFCILATGVDNFTLDNLKIDTNRDGMDIDSCKNVRVSNCYVNSPTDDGICLKSDYALAEPRACENITITNCQVSGYVMGTLLDGTYNRNNANSNNREGPIGRIKLGTESNGGFKNISISNCVFDHCRGLAIESVDGGNIEDITVSNIAMHDIFNSPIFIRLGDRARGPNTPPPAQIKRINISDITASDCAPRFTGLIVGSPDHPIEDVRLSNIRIAYQGGGTAEQAKREPPENKAGYPEPSTFGTLPAAGFYVRHVKNLEMHHIDITFDQPDARPAFVLEDVVGADFQHMKIQRFDGVPLFQLKGVEDFSTQFVKSIADMSKDKIAEQSISQ